LPRLKNSAVLVGAIRDGLGLLLWRQESFAYADSVDEATGRYRGLRAGHAVPLSEHSLTGMLVSPDAAQKQMEAEGAAVSAPIATPAGSRPASAEAAQLSPAEAPPRRFHGSVELDPTRVGRDAARVGEE